MITTSTGLRDWRASPRAFAPAGSIFLLSVVVLVVKDGGGGVGVVVVVMTMVRVGRSSISSAGSDSRRVEGTGKYCSTRARVFRYRIQCVMMKPLKCKVSADGDK